MRTRIIHTRHGTRFVTTQGNVTGWPDTDKRIAFRNTTTALRSRFDTPRRLRDGPPGAA